mmetsp:Transcript_15332/g.38778  ORF Transcript_15332/g.38778 Transcript_15332/m.38778 type:complete len:357 (+) Transcript_15332:53-1123(+)
MPALSSWSFVLGCAFASALTTLASRTRRRRRNVHMHKSRRRRSRSSAAAETEAQVTRSSSKTLMESSQQPLYSFDGAWVRVSGFDEGFQPPLEPSLPEAALTTKEGLENLLKRNNPIAYFVGLSVNHLDEAALTLEAPVLPANSNTHRTGFAGSIYVVAALAVWGKMLSEMYRANMCATHFHVIRRATISYLRPVDRLGNIVATCALPPTTTTTTHINPRRRERKTATKWTTHLAPSKVMTKAQRSSRGCPTVMGVPTPTQNPQVTMTTTRSRKWTSTTYNLLLHMHGKTIRWTSTETTTTTLTTNLTSLRLRQVPPQTSLLVMKQTRLPSLWTNATKNMPQNQKTRLHTKMVEPL